MKAFQYSVATSVGQAANGKSETRSVIAGGTNLVDLIKYGVERPDAVIDITNLPLKTIEEHDGALLVGALVPNSDLAADPRVVSRYPVLSEALLSGASPQLRNMATTGGNLLQRTRCHYFMDTAFPCNKRLPGSGCPAIQGQNRIHAILGTSDQCIAVHPSDMAVAMSALKAIVHVQSPDSSRMIPMEEFHRLPGNTPHLETNLAANEIITAVELPAPPSSTKSHYLKVRDRAEYQFALVSVAAVLTTHGGTISDVTLSLGGVAHKPWRVKEIEANLVGKAAHHEIYREAVAMALTEARGYGHNDFKVELAKRAIIRVLSEMEDNLA